MSTEYNIRRRKFIISLSTSLLTTGLLGCQVRPNRFSPNANNINEVIPPENSFYEQNQKIDLPKVDGNTLLDILDNSPWVPDGHDSATHAYILASTNCPFSKNFYQTTRHKPSNLQLRWIITCNTYSDPIAYEAIVEAAFNRDPKILDRIYNNKLYPTNAKPFDWRAKNAFQYISGVQENITKFERDTLMLNQIKYPSILFASNSGLRRVADKMELLNNLSTIIPRNNLKSIRPNAIEIMNKNYIAASSLQQEYFAKKHSTPCYCLPDLSAPLLSALPRNIGFRGPANLLNNGNISWIEMQPFFHDGNIPTYVYTKLDDMTTYFV